MYCCELVNGYNIDIFKIFARALIAVPTLMGTLLITVFLHDIPP